MRIFITLLIWIGLFGGLLLYMHHRGTAAAATASHFEIQYTEDTYSLVLTPTFTAEPDPFALDIGDDDGPAALRLQLNGREILRRTDTVRAAVPVRIDDLENVKLGANELYLEANPPAEVINQSHAVRLQIFRNDNLLAETTFWSEPGVLLTGTFRFNVEPPRDHEQENH